MEEGRLGPYAWEYVCKSGGDLSVCLSILTLTQNLPLQIYPTLYTAFTFRYTKELDANLKKVVEYVILRRGIGYISLSVVLFISSISYIFPLLI